MKTARKLISARVPLEDFAALRQYAAERGETQDAIVARWLQPLLEAIKPRQQRDKACDAS